MASTSPEVSQLLLRGPARLPLNQAALQRTVDVSEIRSLDAALLFPNARNAQAALAGLLLRVGHWEESHTVAQDINSADGSYWHGIIHRMEPDSFNAGYWFRRAGQHEVFPLLFERAVEILSDRGPKQWCLKSTWDQLLFIEWCDEARASGGQAEATAMEIQMAEWQLLFDWCAGE